MRKVLLICVLLAALTTLITGVYLEKLGTLKELQEYGQLPMALVIVDYAKPVSLAEAYRQADLVVVGRVLGIERVSTFSKMPAMCLTVEVELVIKGLVTTNRIAVWQTGSCIGRFGVFFLRLDDPPLMPGERVILFLREVEPESISGMEIVSVPLHEYELFLGPFGRFEVIDGKVYSLMHVTEELLKSLSLNPKLIDAAKNHVESWLKGSEYERIKGVTLEEFIAMLKSLDEH
ncbi:MAG: hypothetical protein DRJ51_03525 [Thermoprotei archaeon]|nr:MAG: hypothetical protein DRJ51_03525 [Thermoprotei archaeon]